LLVRAEYSLSATPSWRLQTQADLVEALRCDGWLGSVLSSQGRTCGRKLKGMKFLATISMPKGKMTNSAT
jgi:hypothetical protein